MPSSNKHSDSPGKVAGRLNFPLYESVVHVDVRDDVRAAKAAAFSPDPLGLKGPIWDANVEKPKATMKYTITASDSKLSNTLPPALINPQDVRSLRGTMHIKATQNAAFDRGEATIGGWDKSTVTDGVDARNAHDAEMVARSRANSNRLASSFAAASTSYITPLMRQQAVIDNVRDAKLRNEAEAAALVTRYGAEGAEVMKQIMSMKPQTRRARGRATKEDLEAVKGLQDSSGEEECAKEEGSTSAVVTQQEEEQPAQEQEKQEEEQESPEHLHDQEEQQLHESNGSDYSGHARLSPLPEEESSSAEALEDAGDGQTNTVEI